MFKNLKILGSDGSKKLLNNSHALMVLELLFTHKWGGKI